MPLYNVRTLAEHVDRSLYVDRLRATLIGVLATLALALSAIGIYGVLSYNVAEYGLSPLDPVPLGRVRRPVRGGADGRLRAVVARNAHRSGGRAAAAVTAPSS